MYKQASGRSQRTKGFKVKHALQVCVLVAVCVWLLYQVKHSHDKKVALEERNTKVSSTAKESNSEISRIGRKDIPQVIVGTDLDKETQTDEANEEAEEAEAEAEPKTEENEEEEGRGGGDDEIDENDQEKADEEADRGEDLGEAEEKDGQIDDLTLSNSLGHNDAEANSQEAREEHYKGDDASSAVVRLTETTDSEIGNLEIGSAETESTKSIEENDVHIDSRANLTNNSLKLDADLPKNTEEKDTEIGRTDNFLKVDEESTKNIEENNEEKDVEIDSSTSKRDSGFKADENAVSEEDGTLQSNSTFSDEKMLREVDKEDGSLHNSTASDSIDQTEHQNNSTTESFPDAAAEKQNNLIELVGSENNNLPLANTVSKDSVHDTDSTAEIRMNEKENKLNEDEKRNFDPANSASEQSENSTITNEGERSEETSTTSSTTTDNLDGSQVEHNELTSKEEATIEDGRDARADLGTLPEIQGEMKIEDIAQE